MSKTAHNRKPAYQEYYSEEDRELIMAKLPDIIKEAEKRKSELLEPTIFEKRDILKFVKNFIREKGRKVYGGTAINELIKAKNRDDGIYDADCFSDIEFYSPTPVPDMVELCNAIHKAGFKNPEGAEAQHEGTFKVFVNFAPEYCDINYVPAHVYNQIKTVTIDGINYVDPHFIHIDQLRIFNDPMTSAFIWEKTFNRAYKLIKYYPFEILDKNIQIPKPDATMKTLYHKIMKEFLTKSDIQETIVLSGFDAYNFYIRTAAKDANVDKVARVHSEGSTKNNIGMLETEVPFIDIVSVDYRKTVVELMKFLAGTVPKSELITTDEITTLCSNSVVMELCSTMMVNQLFVYMKVMICVFHLSD